MPTFTGFFVDSFLELTFPEYIDTAFTSRMEEGLDKIAAGNESKTEYLDSFWKGGEGFNGLDSDLQTVSSSVRKADVTSLSIPGLKYSFSHDGAEVKYSIRISKFGPYIASDYFDKESGKDRMASIDQTRYFPGTFQDDDARVILFPDSSDVAIAEGISVATGRYGQYLKTSDGRNAMIPRPYRNKVTPELASLIISLPKAIGKSSDGSDIMMMAGPYGFYAKAGGKNIPIHDPFSIDAGAIAAAAEATGSDKESLADFGEYEGQPLVILKGKYGPYLRWGTKNITIPREERAAAAEMSIDRARELCSAAPSSSEAVKDFGEYEGKPLHLVNGRYGLYLRWGDRNCPIPKEEREGAAGMSIERARELASAAPEKTPKRKYTSRRKA